MGIKGLLPFLEKATNSFHLSAFTGTTVAIDAYGLIAKGLVQDVKLDE